jgi:transcriptional regulator with XRE-family HTH domain
VFRHTYEDKRYSTNSQVVPSGRLNEGAGQSRHMAKLRQRTKETFGSRLRAAREEAKLTQEQLGEVLGVTKSQVSYYESDKDNPSYDNLVLAAQTLRRTPTFLLTGTEGAAGEMIDPETYRLLVKVRELPEVLQDFVEEAIKLADRTKHLLPPNYSTPPDSASWHEFQAYLARLAGTLPKDPSKPK